MDPNACYDRLSEALSDRDHTEAARAAADLLEWYARGGFPAERPAGPLSDAAGGPFPAMSERVLVRLVAQDMAIDMPGEDSPILSLLSACYAMGDDGPALASVDRVWISYLSGDADPSFDPDDDGEPDGDRIDECHAFLFAVAGARYPAGADWIQCSGWDGSAGSFSPRADGPDGADPAFLEWVDDVLSAWGEAILRAE